MHGNVDDGWTVDFGKSPFVIRAYDKHKEQANKEGYDTDMKTRVELELHQDKAEYVLDEWLNNDERPYERFNKEYRNMERYKERYIKQKIKKYEQKLAEEINALKDVNLTDIDDDKDVKVDIDDIS